MCAAAIPNRDAFIPCRRHDLIDLCLQSGALDADTGRQFKEFCALLSALYHFRFHHMSEKIKRAYAPFDPNVDVPASAPAEDLKEMRAVLSEKVRHLLEKANYKELSQGSLRRSLETKSLIDLHTQVNFDDFSQVLCYYRGDDATSVTTGRWFWKREQEIKLFERVVLLIHFKDAAHFEKEKDNQAFRRFTPDKAYVYFYKNIPQHDIELLFPNVQTRMTWKDIGMLIVPALAAGVSIVVKILPQLLIVVGAIMLALGFPSALDYFNLSEGEVYNITPVLIATGSLCVALGGFAYKQYSSYKTKKLTFQKNVTDTLFFRNLANNAAVFQLLIDLAEEEECKEVILVYYHLLTSDTALTTEALDHRIEVWMQKHLGADVNFDVADAVQKLTALRTPDASSKSYSAEDKATALLHYDAQNRCHVLPLDKALAVLDQLWDNAFRYAL
ncbi:MAG: TMEM143 family protein [Elainellaceae cyanobacterium]